MVYYGSAFAVPVIILLICFLFKQITPFGDRCLLAMDAWGQYFPMLKEMKRALFSGNMAWSFDGALGFNLWAQSAYYTGSPLWIVLYLLPDAWMITGLHLLIVVRFGLCGMTFAFWLERRYGKRTWGGVAFAAAYALSAYTVAFLNQFMWMDVVILFPLLMTALERLFYQRKAGAYTALLALTIWSNFYLGYMVCLFCVLYFGMLLLEKKMSIRQRISKTFLFFRYSLLGGGICAATLIPVAYALSGTHSSGAGCKNPFELYHSLGEILRNFLPFGKISLEYEFPNVYCGGICVIFFVAAFFIKITGKRRKFLMAGICLFLLLSMNLNVLDYVWHGFHYPNQLPGRQSFLFIFLVLTFGYSAFMAFTDCCRRMAQKHREECFYGCLPAILAFLVILEIGGNAVYMVFTQTWNTGVQKFVQYDKDMEYILEKYRCSAPETTGFYRMERVVPYNLNSGQLYGYQGITYYSSTVKKAAYDFFDALGQDAYADLIIKYYSSPVTNALFAVRYVLCMEEVLPPDENLVLLERRGRIAVLENKSCLPFAFIADDDILSLDYTKYYGIELQRQILNSLCGREVELWEAVQQLKTHPLVIDTFENTRIRGTVYCEKDGVCYTSLPYDEGWSVYVDGKKTPSVTLLGYLTGVKLERGEHQIEFRYEIRGIRTGVILSLISVGFLCYSLYFSENRKKSKKDDTG